jgi:sugar phosphate isomerase/epimerase
MKISVGSWAFTFGPYADKAIAFEDVARGLSEAGYDGIELSGFPPHVTLDKYPDAASRAGLRKFLGDLGLGISGIAADFSSTNPLASGSQAKYVELFRRNLDFCTETGCPAIRVDTVVGPGSIPDSDYHTSMYRLADTWRECADHARRAKVRMVWEFEPGFIFNKPSEIVTLHERVGHPWFQIMFDTSHAYMCGVVGARQHGTKETLDGGVGEFLDLLEGRIGAIHVIDCDGSLHNDETSTHSPFGAGHVPFRALAPKLLAVPNIEWWCVDLCFCSTAWEEIGPSLQYLRKLLS